jgi:hypothetical protein
MSLTEEERGAGSCKCGSGSTRVVMTWSALCYLALLGPSMKALCQEPCLAMVWLPFCSTNSWIWLTEPFKHVSLHVPRTLPDKSSLYPEAIVLVLDFSPVSACWLTHQQSRLYNVDVSGCCPQSQAWLPSMEEASGHREPLIFYPSSSALSEA